MMSSAALSPPHAHRGCAGQKQSVCVSAHEIDVTASGPGFSIVSVRNRTEQLLTKRRAVDFCRVAAALCRMA